MRGKFFLNILCYVALHWLLSSLFALKTWFLMFGACLNRRGCSVFLILKLMNDDFPLFVVFYLELVCFLHSFRLLPRDSVMSRMINLIDY